MSDIVTPGLHPRESEFVNGLTGTCGPDSCAMVEWAATGSETHTYDVYTRMRAGGWCDANGGSDSLQWDAYLSSRPSVRVVDRHYYAGDSWAGWQSYLEGHAGSGATVLELANGQALRDLMSGLGENAVNLRYHIIAVWGVNLGGVSQLAGGRVLPPGVWASDGDNWAAGNNVLQYYPYSVLAAALPCAAVTVEVKPQMLSITDPMAATFFSANPDGTWHCKATGANIIGDMLNFYRSYPGGGQYNGLSALGLPLGNEVGQPQAKAPGDVETPTIQQFERGIVAFDPHRRLDEPPGAVGNEYIAHSVDHLLAQVSGLNQQLQQTTTQLGQDAAQIATLTTQHDADQQTIAQLQAQLAGEPVPGNPVEHQKAVALDAVMALYGVR